MKIISDFKDYYDCCMRLGHEELPQYRRFHREIEVKNYRETNLKMDQGLVRVGAVWFCGKLYPFVEFMDSIYDPLISTVRTYKQTFCYTIDEVDIYVESKFKDDVVDSYKSTDKYTKSDFRISRRSQFVETFAGKHSMWSDYDYEKIILEHVTLADPIARIEKFGGNGLIKINCRLNEVQFFKVFDPTQAFQALEMYLNNVAVPLNPIPDISDKDMAASKGYDKWSFRKPPKDTK